MTHLDKLNDADFPAFTTGQAARVLEVQEAFLRSLDSADLVHPERSGGGHRRYTRRQLTLIARLREQLDDGHTLAAAARIIGLQDRLADTETRLADAQDQLCQTEGQLADAEGTIADLRRRLDEHADPPPENMQS